MDSNRCSHAVADQLERLAPGELLAVARAAVERYAADGGERGALLAHARATVDRAAGEPLDGSVDDGVLVDSVVAYHRLGNAVHAEMLRRIGEVEERGAFRGQAHNSVNLWVSRLGVSHTEARTLLAAADVLQQMPQVAARHADGTLGAGHVADTARTVAQLDRLVRTNREEDRERATVAEQRAEMVDELDRLVARQADRATGGPGAGDDGNGAEARAAGQSGTVARQALRQQLEEFAHERAPELLAERELRLRAMRNLRLTVDERHPDRPPRILGDLAPVTYAKATRVLHGLAGKHSAGDARTFAQRCHDAFDQVLDIALASGALPDVAGDQPRVLLLVDADTLHERPDAPPATLDGYGAVSTPTARQICCDAEVTAVAKGDGREILNVGRDQRKPNRAQRRATFGRDGGCIGCGAPLAYCQIHHVDWWEHGGRTDIDKLVAVCWDCHARIHHLGWRVLRCTDGRYTLRPAESRAGHRADRAHPPERRAS